MPGGVLPRADSELVILRVAHNAAREYEWRQHERLAQGAGLSAAEVRAGARRRRGRRLAPHRQSLLLRAADELHEERTISDELWAELRPLLSDQELIELCMLVGHYEMLAMTLNALAVEPDPVPARPPSARSGRSSGGGRRTAGASSSPARARGIGALLAPSGCTTAARRWRCSGWSRSCSSGRPRACGGAPWFECDVADRAQVDDAVASAVERLGGLDVAVANAGIGAQMALVDGDPRSGTRRSR